MADLGVKAISVVSGEMAVAFCRDYELDLVLLDLGMGDARDAVRLLAENKDTAEIPILGLGGVGDGMGWESLCGVLEADMKGGELAQGLRKCLEGGSCLERGGGVDEVVGAASFAGSSGGIHENPLPVLLDLSGRILELARELAGSVTEFGPDGPEMFKFVEKSSEQMHQRLVKIASSEPKQQENQLRDREVRHEFRNILASVRGFTDLILMEQGIPEDLVSGLKEICGCSNQFVEWLDAEKAAALGQLGEQNPLRT